MLSERKFKIQELARIYIQISNLGEEAVVLEDDLRENHRVSEKELEDIHEKPYDYN